MHTRSGSPAIRRRARTCLRNGGAGPSGRKEPEWFPASRRASTSTSSTVPRGSCRSSRHRETALWPTMAAQTTAIRRCSVLRRISRAPPRPTRRQYGAYGRRTRRTRTEHDGDARRLRGRRRARRRPERAGRHDGGTGSVEHPNDGDAKFAVRRRNDGAVPVRLRAFSAGARANVSHIGRRSEPRRARAARSAAPRAYEVPFADAWSSISRSSTT